MHYNAGCCNNRDSRLNHDLIYDPRVCFHFEIAFLRDVHKAGEEGLSWNSEIIVHKIAIVDILVANLGSNVANLDARKDFVSIDVSNWYNKWLNTIICSKRDASSENYGMSGLDTKIARPEFCCLDCRTMNDEFICL